MMLSEYNTQSKEEIFIHQNEYPTIVARKMNHFTKNLFLYALLFLVFLFLTVDGVYHFIVGKPASGILTIGCAIGIVFSGLGVYSWIEVWLLDRKLRKKYLLNFEEE